MLMNDERLANKPLATVARALVGGEQARVLAIEARDLVAYLRELHHLSSTATAALGRLSMAAILMAEDMKKTRGARVSLRIEGGGPLGVIMADAESAGKVRGFVQNPGVEPSPNGEGKIDVAAGVGTAGTLTVAKSLGFGEPVTGSIALVSGEIAEDVAHYYVRSEQTPSAVLLGVRVHPEEGVVSAGGLLVQVFPDTAPEFVGEIEKRVRNLSSVSLDMAEKGNPKRMVEALFEGEEIYWLGENGFDFECRCSRDFAASLLLGALGEEIPEEPQEVRCPFCNTSYLFQPAEVRSLRAAGSAS